MKKTVEIGGKTLTLKANASFLLIYREQFGRDALQDVFPLLQLALPVMALAQGETLEGDAAMSLASAMQSFDVLVFADLLWALVKNADKDTPDPEEWLDTFDDFPIVDAIAQVVPLMLESLIAKKKAAQEKVEKRAKGKSTPIL